jgi:uncharacterized membrane protein YphA (DoxX/SURF4 family)
MRNRLGGHLARGRQRYDAPAALMAPRYPLERNIAMNIALWILQGLLALSLLASGGMKFAKSKAKLVSDSKMAWATDFSETQIKLIASAEVAGAVGLIVPWATLIAPVLTPVAAVCLAILLLGAARIHFARKESFAPPLVIAILCLIVAVGRSGLLSLPSDDFRRATALRAAQPFASGIERLAHSIEASGEMTVHTIGPPALRMADNMPNLSGHADPARRRSLGAAGSPRGGERSPVELP